MECRSRDYSRVLRKYDLYKIHLVSQTLCNTVILHYTLKAYSELEKCQGSLWSDILKPHSSQTYVSCVTTTRCYSGTWTSCAWQQHASQSDSAAQLDLTYFIFTDTLILILMLHCHTVGLPFLDHLQTHRILQWLLKFVLLWKYELRLSCWFCIDTGPDFECGTIWKEAILLTFKRNVLPPPPGSKWIMWGCRLVPQMWAGKLCLQLHKIEGREIFKWNKIVNVLITFIYKFT